ncbi:hypothetical protein Tco_1577356 [Tanacetum coccineum]
MVVSIGIAAAEAAAGVQKVVIIRGDGGSCGDDGVRWWWRPKKGWPEVWPDPVTAPEKGGGRSLSLSLIYSVIFDVEEDWKF